MSARLRQRTPLVNVDACSRFYPFLVFVRRRLVEISVLFRLDFAGDARHDIAKRHGELVVRCACRAQRGLAWCSGTAASASTTPVASAAAAPSIPAASAVISPALAVPAAATAVATLLVMLLLLFSDVDNFVGDTQVLDLRDLGSVNGAGKACWM